jgi:hypothetical protein
MPTLALIYDDPQEPVIDFELSEVSLLQLVMSAAEEKLDRVEYET